MIPTKSDYELACSTIESNIVNHRQAVLCFEIMVAHVSEKELPVSTFWKFYDLVKEVEWKILAWLN